MGKNLIYCGSTVDTYSIWAYSTFRVRARIRRDRALLEEVAEARLQIPPVGRDDKGRVVAYLRSCDWDVWTSARRAV